MRPGRVELSDDERRYAAAHWDLLGRLRRALRTERDIRLAVLFGSVATGFDRRASDVDLLIVRRSGSSRARAALSLRLGHVLGRKVHLVDLGDAEHSYGLMADVLREGRPILDRDGLWKSLLGRREEILSAVEGEDRALLDEAQKAVRAARRRIA